MIQARTLGGHMVMIPTKPNEDMIHLMAQEMFHQWASEIGYSARWEEEPAPLREHYLALAHRAYAVLVTPAEGERT